MIVKRKAARLPTPDRRDGGQGYYVLSEKTRRNLGGPYKTRDEAVKWLRQVEYFKHFKP